MRGRKWFWSFAALALMVGFTGSALAGTVGKIAGQVMDSKGQPLPGVSVTIEGTKRGAVTGADGSYFILNVDPGTYKLAASLIGYQKETRTDVRVQADFTTDLNFRLREEAVQLGEIVVQAERPAVEVDKTVSKFVVDAKQISSVSILKSTVDFVSLQPGVDVRGNSMIRGADLGSVGSGAGSDVAYYVDGVKLTHNDGRKTSLFTGINKTSVQELTVITGGMDAEYGNAQGGIISVVTKDGAQRYSGWAEYRFTPPGKKHWGRDVYEAALHKDKVLILDPATGRWTGQTKFSDPTWANEVDPVTGRQVHAREDYTDIQGHDLELSLQGPLGKNLSFIGTTRYTRQATASPGPFRATPFNTQNTLSLTYRPSPNLKVKVGGLYQQNDEWPRPQNWYSRTTLDGALKGLDYNGRNLFLPEDWTAQGRNTLKETMLYLNVTHTLSPKTFYELRISRTQSTKDTTGVPGITTDPVLDKDKWFVVDRKLRQFEKYDRTRYQFKGDVSSQVSKGHFLKAGFDITQYAVALSWFTFNSPQNREIFFVSRTPGQPDSPTNRAPVRPLQGAIYVQDKMEFQGMVVNAGLRLDWLSPREKTSQQPSMPFSPMYNTPVRYRNVPLKSARTHSLLSPRIGISHPITARSTVHFFSGLFLQWPDISYLFSEEWRGTVPDTDRNANGRIDPEEEFTGLSSSATVNGFHGNVDLKPERTLSFEVGGDWNFVSDYTASITTFYKSAKDQYRYSSDCQWFDPQRNGLITYSRALYNNGFEDVRGFDLNLKKPISKNFSFNVSYSLMWADRGWGGYDAWVKMVIPDSNYVASGNYWYTYRVENGREVPVPLTTAEIQTMGNRANNYLRNFGGVTINGAGNPTNSVGDPAGRGFVQVAKPLKDYGYTGAQDNLWLSVRSYWTGLEGFGGRDTRNQGALQVLYATPKDYGPPVNFLGNRLFGNWRANMIFRAVTGGAFNYSPPGKAQERRQGPLRTWIDASLEKTLSFKGGSEAVFFVEAFNLFNQKDSNTTGPDYVQAGLQIPRPDNPDYVKYGDELDRPGGRYLGSPRSWGVGLRMSF
ncbi:MAG: TonB-dependent receptor [Candidatus Latescibacteria bacterium]|nr:TonB-dependent receptor [Candidatus Latescibacterota bacterium]